MNVLTTTWKYAFVLSGIVVCSGANAAVHTVPTQHANILNAFNSASNGDEIRVRKDYVETETDVDLVGKDVTIRSYSMDYSTPENGAKWIGTAFADIYGKNARIESGSITIEGFAELTGTDCNVFQLGNNSAITVRDCVLSGTRRADTAAIKSVYHETNHPNVNNVSISIENTTATANGRVVWTRGNTGTTSLAIRNSVFVDNTSYPVMWEPYDGTHNVDIADNNIEIHGTATATRNFRFLAQNAPVDSLVLCDINIERNYFHTTTRGRACINLNGIDTATYNSNSTLTTVIRNCVFDLTQGPDNSGTLVYSSDELSTSSKADVDMEHCTVIFGGENQSGIRLTEYQTVFEVANCIFDGDGEGYVAFRSLRGKTISYKNLMYSAGKNGNQHETLSGGSVEYSGTEILGVSAEFADRANRDLTLAAGSPALAVGVDIGIVDDILGNLRPNPVGSLPDLGAYEMSMVASISDWAVY